MLSQKKQQPLGCGRSYKGVVDHHLPEWDTSRQWDFSFFFSRWIGQTQETCWNGGESLWMANCSVSQFRSGRWIIPGVSSCMCWMALPSGTTTSWRQGQLQVEENMNRYCKIEKSGGIFSNKWYPKVWQKLTGFSPSWAVQCLDMSNALCFKRRLGRYHRTVFPSLCSKNPNQSEDDWPLHRSRQSQAGFGSEHVRSTLFVLYTSRYIQHH